MIYNMEAIAKLDNQLKRQFKIYQELGHGVQESPLQEGRTIQVIECTEFEAWLIAEAKNIELNGLIRDRSSWESPTIRYKRI